MKGEWYVGMTTSNLTYMPLRLGSPFVTETVEDARREGCTILNELGIRYGFLCRVKPKDRQVEIRGTLRHDGFYSPLIMMKGKSVSDDESVFEGTWRKVEPPNARSRARRVRGWIR